VSAGKVKRFLSVSRVKCCSRSLMVADSGRALRSPAKKIGLSVWGVSLIRIWAEARRSASVREKWDECYEQHGEDGFHGVMFLN